MSAVPAAPMTVRWMIDPVAGKPRLVSRQIFTALSQRPSRKVFSLAALAFTELDLTDHDLLFHPIEDELEKVLWKIPPRLWAIVTALGMFWAMHYYLVNTTSALAASI